MLVYFLATVKADVNFDSDIDRHNIILTFRVTQASDKRHYRVCPEPFFSP